MKRALVIVLLAACSSVPARDREPFTTWYAQAKARGDLKSLALAWRVEQDPAALAKAAEILRAATYESMVREKILDEQDAVRDLAVAFHLVKDGLDGADRGHVEAVLRRFGERCATYDPGWYRWHVNNWQVRQYALLGIIAVALDDAALFDVADREVRRAIEFQVVGEGAWAEGHAYLAYSASMYLPFFHLARPRFDYFRWGPVVRVHRWSVLSRLPDGRRPNFDDSHLGGFQSYLVPGGLTRWDFDHGAGGVDPVFAYLWFDDARPAPPDVGPTIHFRDAGNLIFRTGWDRDATMLFVLAERGEARTRGWGHEHPDGTSFMLYSRGRWLAIDSGYGNYLTHHRVLGPEHHNRVLVDGQGPGFIMDDVEILELDDAHAVVEARFSGAVLRREFRFGDPVVIVDTCESDREREFTAVVHTLEPGDDAEHSFDWGRFERHRVHRRSARGSRVRFTTTFDLAAGTVTISND